ncbi:hypothetical protein SAMN05421810_102198 [Amycolatopsis arida]|uniref:Uncharacterized protein n=1 Tax=Amycolatopsis arida TaxID=587909 RepID=A0A1I5P8T4_9PSEU|nr:hypothetical protein CLV69_101198 [Amycolatopsis arida]SFP30492.1 hypothetical protein SAMN05421810_102198 [Amycolatopsis arida]
MGDPDHGERREPRLLRDDLNGHSGFRTAEQGARVVVELATLGADGPTGVLWGPPFVPDGDPESVVLPW